MPMPGVHIALVRTDESHWWLVRGYLPPLHFAVSLLGYR